MLDWQHYLAYLRAHAHRKALQEADLAPEDAQPSPYPHRDGSGEVKLEYTLVMDTPPWDAANLAQYDQLANGGEWELESSLKDES